MPVNSVNSRGKYLNHRKFRGKKTRLLVIVSVVLICFGMAGVVSFADDPGFVTERYNVDAKVNKDHTVEVTDTITVNFYEYKHGIYRYIPYDSDRYYISDIRVVGRDDYETKIEDGNKIIRIGSEDSTVIGRQVYEIQYTMVCYEDTIPDKDFLALDLIPNSWATAIENATVSLSMPKKLDWEKVRFYGDTYGGKNLNENYYLEYNKDNNSVTITGRNLPTGVGLTAEGTLPNGYWEGAKNNEWARIPLTAVLALIPILTFLMWMKWGRDPKIVKTVEFYPPEDMTPAEIGYIIDGTTDYKDMASMVIYYANKGYLEMKQLEDDKVELIKIKDIDDTEKKFSKTFFEGLFSCGNKVRLDEMPEEFAGTYKTAVDELKGYYTKKNRIFTRTSSVCRGMGCLLTLIPAVLSMLAASYIGLRFTYALLAIPSFFFIAVGMCMIVVSFDKKDSLKPLKKRIISIIGTILMGLGLAISMASIWLCIGSKLIIIEMLISMAITCVFTVLMGARTEQSVIWQGKILGFKNFIKAAELEKLKMLADEDPDYFYNVMPYAYVMGLSDKWAKKFEKIPTENPNWYSGDSGNAMFNIIMMNHIMHSYSNTISSSVLSMSGSDSGGGGTGGGFGGGGFSGGGFGGGGGGSW